MWIPFHDVLVDALRSDVLIQNMRQNQVFSRKKYKLMDTEAEFQAKMLQEKLEKLSSKVLA